MKEYDRGLHVLNGENKFRGRTYSTYRVSKINLALLIPIFDIVPAQAWFRSIHHYIFLSDPRTERVIGEPRRDNAAIMRTTQDAGMREETVGYNHSLFKSCAHLVYPDLPFPL